MKETNMYDDAINKKLAKRKNEKKMPFSKF